MHSVTVVEAKSRLSALQAEVEAGAEIAVTRHGKVIARLVPYRPWVAAEAVRDFWSERGRSISMRPMTGRPTTAQQSCWSTFCKAFIPHKSALASGSKNQFSTSFAIKHDDIVTFNEFLIAKNRMSAITDFLVAILNSYFIFTMTANKCN